MLPLYFISMKIQRSAFSKQEATLINLLSCARIYRSLLPISQTRFWTSKEEEAHHLSGLEISKQLKKTNLLCPVAKPICRS